MQKAFPGYQPRTSRDLGKLWDNCTFTFDASALLDLYRMTRKTREEFLSILDRLKERVWLPHQTGLEYHDNRLEVIRTGLESHKRIAQWAHKAADGFKQEFDRLRRYQWIEADRLLQVWTRACEQIEQLLAKEECELQGYETSDPVQKRLVEIFSGRVGQPYKDMHEVYERAERRIQLSIPPGFRDAAEKKDFRRYGDVVLWLQLLDFAKSSQTAIVFVTSDSKEDWWQRQNGKTTGPRPELIQEMYVAGGVAFHMYTPATFIEHAGKYLELQVEAAKIKAAAKELRDMETEKAPSAGIRLDWDRLFPENPVAAYIARDLQNPLSTLRNQEFLRVLENSQGPLAKILGGHPLYPTDAMARAFNELFVNPVAQFRAAAEQLVNTPVGQLRETAAQLARVVESVTNPLSVFQTAAKSAGQSQAKGELKESGHVDGSEADRSKVNASKKEQELQERGSAGVASAKPGELKSRDGTQPDDKDEPSGEREK